MKESAFIEKYGENEKTKLFIKKWFGARKTFIILTSISLTAVAVAAIIFGPYTGGGNSIGSFYAELGLVLTAMFGGLAAILFFIPVLTHSRKKLYRILEKHKNGERIPKRFRKQLEGD